MVNDDVERVTAALADLCEPLHDVFTSASLLTKERLPELTGDDYAWHTTHTIRALAHRSLSERDLGRWRLTGKHSRNGELWMSDGDYRIRVLHALPDFDVPPAGSTRARRAYYSNTPLVLQQPLIGPPNDRLLGIWRIDPKKLTAGFRIIRPIGTWKLGSKAKTDLSFVLPQLSDDLDLLEWEALDEGLEYDLPEDIEEEGDEDAGGFSG